MTAPSPQILDAVKASLTGTDPVADMLRALRPFALAGMEGMFAEGGCIAVGPNTQSEEARIDYVDLMRAWVAWSIYDPLARHALMLGDPVLRDLFAAQDARAGDARRQAEGPSSVRRMVRDMGFALWGAVVGGTAVAGWLL